MNEQLLAVWDVAQYGRRGSAELLSVVVDAAIACDGGVYSSSSVLSSDVAEAAEVPDDCLG